jgi:hypothetical protein
MAWRRRRAALTIVECVPVMVAKGEVEGCSGGVLHELEGIRLPPQHKDGGKSSRHSGSPKVLVQRWHGDGVAELRWTRSDAGGSMSCA